MKVLDMQICGAEALFCFSGDSPAWIALVCRPLPESLLCMKSSPAKGLNCNITSRGNERKAIFKAEPTGRISRPTAKAQMGAKAADLVIAKPETAHLKV
jgi:hypothetical protein